MDGNMRRLPPWMLDGASSNRKGEKSRKKKHEPEAPKKKAQKRPRRTVKVEERDGSEEPKKVEMRRRGGGDGAHTKTKEKEAKSSIGRDGKSPEIIQSVSGPEEEYDLTVDDLLSFAQEYVKGEQDQTGNERESLSASESILDVNDESNMTGETRDPTSDDMLNLLLGPFFSKKSHY